MRFGKASYLRGLVEEDVFAMQVTEVSTEDESMFERKLLSIC